MRVRFVIGKGVAKEEAAKIRKLAINTTHLDRVEAIIVAGGDGAMLEAVQKYGNLGKPFLGINKGHVGFLMNDVNPNSRGDLKKLIAQAAPLKLWFVEGDVHFSDDTFETVKGFNEISWAPDGGHALKMKLTVGDHGIDDTIMGDGFIFSTPQGSTAYNRNAYGKVIKPGMDILQLTPKFCEIGPQRIVMSSFLESIDTEFRIDFLDWEWRPLNVFYDNSRVKRWRRDIKAITLRKSEEKVNLLFNSEFDFYDKVYRLKFHQ